MRWQATLTLGAAAVGCHLIAGLDEPVPPSSGAGAASATTSVGGGPTSSGGAGGGAGAPECPSVCVFDTKQVLITTGGPLWPRLVWSDGDYGLAWQADGGGMQRIFFARLNPNGSEMGPPIPLGDVNHSLRPSLAWTGSSYIVTWQVNLSTYQDVWVQTLTPEGATTPLSQRVFSDDRNLNAPAMAWGADAELMGIAFEQPCDSVQCIHGITNSPGAMLPPVHMLSAGRAGDSHDVFVASNGTTFAAAWQYDGLPGVYFRLFSGSGAQGVAMRAGTEGSSGAKPSIAANGIDYALVWDPDTNQDSMREVWFRRVSDSNPGHQVWQGGGSASQPSIVAAGDCWAVAWAVNDALMPGIYLQMLEPDGTPLEPIVSIASAAASQPSLVYNGRVFAVAWREGVGTEASIRFATCSP